MEGKEKGERGAPLCAADLSEGSRMIAAAICSFGMVEVEGGDCSELILFRGEGRKEKRSTYVITNDKHAPAYINVKPELWFIHLFLFCVS